jgi:uncharacterized protein (DUF488 family)
MRSSNARASTKTAPFLFARERMLLLLLDALGGSAGNLDFQKLLFLYCQDPASGRPYDFVPYRFGAFSFTSYADRRRLVERGLLLEDEHWWRLSDAGRRITGRTPDLHVTAFASEHRSLRGDALIAKTYREFPYYATRSEIAARVLNGDRKALGRIASARRVADQVAVQTIGYEGRTLEGYLNTLIGAGVNVLCDVRRNAISRKYGFSMGTLSRGCEGVGIRYEHVPELGIASERRQGLDSQADYDALFAEYTREWLPLQAGALQRIEHWVHEGERVALTCYEHLPEHCHRHCVAEALEARFGEQFRAKHL